MFIKLKISKFELQRLFLAEVHHPCGVLSLDSNANGSTLRTVKPKDTLDAKYLSYCLKLYTLI